MSSQPFTFRTLSNKTFPSLEANSTKESLLKWGLDGRISIQAFSYDNFFQEYQKEDFVKSFFSDVCIQKDFQVIVAPSKWIPLGSLGVESVNVQVIPSSVTNMGFFDKLYKEGLVRSSGMICKCYDEQIDDILVSDEVRKMLLSDESDFEDVYTEEEKNEFIYCLFRHLCIGGPICQYEDSIKPYLDTTKFLYKDIISVHKDIEGKVAVSSIVLKVSAMECHISDLILTEQDLALERAALACNVYYKDGEHMIFPGASDHIQNFAYLIIDPMKRHLTTLYHSWEGFK